MQKIVPHLWFDTQAKEAAEFYSSVFPDSKVTNVSTLHGTPSGDTEVVSFRVWGHEFMAISAGPLFQLNPSISFMVNFDPSMDEAAASRIDKVWEQLADGGEVLIPIGEYPFSPRYGWVQDRYGVSWQPILTDPTGDDRPTIIPSLLFAGDVYGRAREALEFYTAVFDDAEVGQLVEYPPGMEPHQPGTVMFSDFRLVDSWFVAMDGADEHAHGFNEAISLMVSCSDQAEVDHYWERLSAVPEAEQCGWCKDRFGVSWQVTSTAMAQMMGEGTPEQVDRVTQAFLPMKKLDLAALQEAYEGK